MKKDLAKKLTAALSTRTIVCFLVVYAKREAAPTTAVPAAAGTEEAKPEGMQVPETAGGKTYSIVYLTLFTASQFWTYVGTDIENAMKNTEEKKGVKTDFSIVGPAEESQTEDYITAFEQCIMKKSNVIVTATLAINATVPKAKEVTQNGAILNFANCRLGVEDDGAYGEDHNRFYYCPNDTIGEMAAQTSLKTMDAKSMNRTKGIISTNMNTEGEALNHRIQSFRDYMATNTFDLTLTGIYYNDNVVETSQTNVENIIPIFGSDPIGMYPGNNIADDDVCLTVQVADIRGRIVSVAVDSDNMEISALKNSSLDVIVVQDAYVQGYKCTENAIQTLVNGPDSKSVKQVNCPPVIITSSNMNGKKMQDLLDPTRLKE